MSDVPQRLVAALADRYVIEREIGAGGMATVYLARDLRHKRSVAVKFVRPELGGREGVERFLREIELAARLQHPHILPVFDSGTVEDGTGAPVPYFVMPYVEGETLRQRLQRERRLPVEAATTLASEVADALGYAHAHGVVHRDIKPENILLSGGHAVVADFGVARALEQGTAAESTAESTRLTRAGIAIGTPLYMSPEQATGEVVDARSDQYSLGCVLYEMLAGEPPFTGPTTQSVVAKSLSAPRPHVTRARPEVSPELEQVVLRTMALESAGRYPDMAALGAALRGAQGAPSRGRRRRVIAIGALALVAAAVAGAWLATRAPGRKVAPAAETLAVLPFHASGPGMDFLSEGMMDLLATNLRGVGGINTVDPRVVLREWGSSPGSDDLTRALAVGRDVDAGSVVLGSAVSTGGRVRLAADLYSVRGEQLGRAQVDGPADSVLAVVDRLSLALLRDVWRSKEPIPNLRVASLTTDSIDALRSYLQGERYYRRLEWDSALAAYTRAVESDSTFALAHLRRAQTFGWTGGYGSKDAHEAIAAGMRFATRLPPRDRRLLAGFRLFDEGKPAAIDSMRAFVAQYPEDVEGWYLLGESMFHINGYRPAPPESISAVFDSVLRRDSTLYLALLHPLDLALSDRDSVRFARYFQPFAGTAPAAKVKAMRTAAGLIWGPKPSSNAIAAALDEQATWIVQAANSVYRQDAATSDTVLEMVRRVGRSVPPVPSYQARTLAWKASVVAGLGRWREAQVVLDSLKPLDPGKALGIQAWSVALGLAPPSFRGLVDSAVKSVPRGPQAEYAGAMVQLLRGRVAEARRQLARALANRDSAFMSHPVRGLMVAADGWAAVLQGDSVGGIRRMREGLDLAAAPNEESVFPRLQFALALAARPETRAEGIRWLRYGFNAEPLYLPLTYLALGHTYEAAGQRDSSAQAYGRFLRLWDKADPELQGRVTEARHALEEITKERP
ncbi:MAG: protein kinase domain-containing protein [Gemmatimonadales bacterium]